MEITPATLRDVDRIADLERAHADYKPLLPSSIEAAVVDEEAEVLVATDGGVVADSTESEAHADGERSPRVVGHVITNPDGAVVSYVVQPSRRGEGIGTRLLEESNAVKARVRADNQASAKAVEAAGFDRVGEQTAGNENLLVFEREDQQKRDNT